MFSINKYLTIAAIAGAVAVPAMAGNDMGPYIGADIGQGHVDAHSGLGSSASGDATAWGIYGGYQFNPYVGAELGYRDFGSTNLDNFGSSSKAHAVQGSVIGTLPVNDIFGVYGRLGLANVHFSSDDAGISSSKTTSVLGVGASFKVAPQVKIRAEYDYYPRINVDGFGDNAKLSAWTVGANYAF
jgi:OOP family OmpA-OmpF porin